MHWFLYAIGGAVIIGVFVGLFKIPAYKNYRSLPLLLFTFLTSGIVAVILFHGYFHLTSIGVIICAAAWGFLFALMSAIQMYTLRFIDVGVLSPLSSAANLALIVALSAIFFSDKISMYAWIGVALAVLIVLALVERKSGRTGISVKVYLLIAAIIGINICYSFFLKYETAHFSIEAVQLYQYFFAALATLGFAALGRERLREVFSTNLRPLVTWGILLGTLSAFGGYSYYLSIEYGPFALASAINALYIIVAVITAAILFKEKLTWKRLVLVLLAIVAVLLMRV